MKKNVLALLMLSLILLIPLASCARTAGESLAEPEVSSAPAVQKEASVPSLPEDLTMKDGLPVLTVYDVKTGAHESMDVERYVMGVLAGEMRNDWPMEALKAQAVLARTFVLKFIDEKESMYGGADISTDIKEAQAYDAEKINERIEKAVSETRGQVLSHDGELPYTWFHAHAGGMTELPTLALDFKDDDPDYTRVTESPDSNKAPTSVKNWSVSFSAEEVAQAARDSGVSVDEISSIELGEKGESGRTVFFLINGEKVSAPSLRLNLDSTRLKSTLLDSVSLKDGKITFTGRGYGHGVGLSQWGAYGMAEEGAGYREIVLHYFPGTAVVQAW